jgi:hypothetical protein
MEELDVFDVMSEMIEFLPDSIKISVKIISVQVL